MQQKYTAIEKALGVLECFSDSNPELTIREIAVSLGIPFSTAHRTIKVLVDAGYLYRNPNSKVLSLGAKLYYLGKIANKSMNIINISLPLMERLRDITGETVNLYFREGNSRICYEHAESNQTLKHSAKLGKRFPLWAGASGKCFLSYLPENEFNDIVSEAKPLTANTITSREQFVNEIRTIRSRGYSKSLSEREEGVASIAVPIFNQEGKVTACIAVSGPSFRIQGQQIDHIIEQTLIYAKEISFLLGFKEKNGQEIKPSHLTMATFPDKGKPLV